MTLPGVDITLLNNQVGTVEGTDDNLFGLIFSGASTGSISLNEPKKVSTLQDLTDLGIDDSYDTNNSTTVRQQMEQFYFQAGEGVSVWIMLVDPTTTMTDICDETNDLLTKLLDTDTGIRMVGIDRHPGSGYTPTYTNGIDDDVNDAISKAQNTAESYADTHQPFRIVLGARDYQGTEADLEDLLKRSDNRVQLTLEGLDSGSVQAAVGRVMGKYAAIPVHRKIARVKDGDLGINNAYLTDGNPIEDHASDLGNIHDKGYVIPRTFKNKSGYFYNDDHSATGDSDDYSSIARGRVIDKVHVITYTTFVEEIQNDLETDQNGNMDPSYVKDQQRKIEEAIEANMMAPGQDNEISNVTAVIDPNQDIIATSLFVIKKIGVRPKAYSKDIDISLGFNNPAAS